MIKLVETDFGAIKLSNKFGKYLSSIKSLSLGDGRRREVRIARRELDNVEQAIKKISEAAWAAGLIDVREIFPKIK